MHFAKPRVTHQEWFVGKAKRRLQRFASDSWIMHFLLLYCDCFVFLVLIFRIIYNPGFRSRLFGSTLNVCTILTWLEFRTWGDLTIPASVCVNAPSVLHVWYSSRATENSHRIILSRKWVNPKSTIMWFKTANLSANTRDFRHKRFPYIDKISGQLLRCTFNYANQECAAHG